MNNLRAYHLAVAELIDDTRKAGHPAEAAALAAEAQVILHAIRDAEAVQPVPYRCIGGYCGATDCASCFPGSWDSERKEAVSELHARLDEIIARACGEVVS